VTELSPIRQAGHLPVSEWQSASSPKSNRKSKRTKTNQDELKRTFASGSSSTLVYEIEPSSTLPLLPSSLNLRPARTYDPTMGSNAWLWERSDLWNTRYERDGNWERIWKATPTEHPEETNRKTHQLTISGFQHLHRLFPPGLLISLYKYRYR